MLVEANLYNADLADFSLTVHSREVLMDTRGAPRLTVALSALPVPTARAIMNGRRSIKR